MRPAMRRYIELSAAWMARLNARIESALGPSPDLIVWGTGQLAMKLARETALAKAPIIAWVDGNPVHHGRKLRGAPVLAPGKIDTPTAPVLITTLLHMAAIEKRIRSLGWNNEVMRLG